LDFQRTVYRVFMSISVLTRRIPAVGFTVALLMAGCASNNGADKKEAASNEATTRPETTPETTTEAVMTTEANSTVATGTVASSSWSPDTIRTPIQFTFSDGSKANGEIAYPTGDGPFPTVVLFHGSGSNDMDQTIPGQPGESKVLRQIAVNLTGRGFAVVRYNKRGVTDIGPKVEQPGKVYTLTTYIDDAQFVLKAVRKLERVNSKRIVLLGHSEGTLTASVIAQSKAGSDIAGLALLGVVGRDIKSALNYQLIDTTIEQLQPIGKTPGLLTLDELVGLFTSMPEEQRKANLEAFELKADPSAASGYRFSVAIDPNGDGALDLAKELRPLWQERFDKSFPNLQAFGMSSDDTEWVADTQSYGEVGSILAGYAKPVLLMNGDGDIQTVVAGAREAYDKMITNPTAQVELKTYPGLGHTFYPASGTEQPLGPMEVEPLQDLGDWLVKQFGSGN
jgi:uncharacterized protein